jgi:hypothetical protein
VITIVNYDCTTFIVQATGLRFPGTPTTFLIEFLIEKAIKMRINLASFYNPIQPQGKRICAKTGKPNRKGRLSTVDLLIQVAHFVKNVNNMISIKSR